MTADSGLLTDAEVLLSRTGALVVVGSDELHEALIALHTFTVRRYRSGFFGREQLLHDNLVPPQLTSHPNGWKSCVSYYPFVGPEHMA